MCNDESLIWCGCSGSAVASPFSSPLQLAPQTPDPIVTAAVLELQGNSTPATIPSVTLTWMAPNDNMNPILRYGVHSKLDQGHTLRATN